MMTEKEKDGDSLVSRRGFIAGSGAALAGLAGMAASQGTHAGKYEEEGAAPKGHGGHADFRLGTSGAYESRTLDPKAFLTHFHYGDEVEDLGDGRKRRTYEFVAVDKEIEIAPGVMFPAWVYGSPGAVLGENGHCPGPTIRAREGDEIVINFLNQGSHPHSIHFHGFHNPKQDGSMPGQMVAPSGTWKYEFEADPVGLHLYHCHSLPLKRHIHKGLYGAFIVDPKEGREKTDHEFVMVMNGFDTNFDGDNEVYAVNSAAFAYMAEPIPVEVGKLVRVYLVNLTEFDPVNSFHVHANFFYENRTGTSKLPREQQNYTDTVMFCQGERSILEMSFRYPGKYMFHAHQSEFAELGWMGFFEAHEPA